VYKTQKIDSSKISSTILQPTIATWYKTLRLVALVGLLSVLVYIGIRILISSAGEERAKYKKMIWDWLVAICILFVLQYIMIFILEISNKITEMLAVNIVGPNGEDTLVSNLRNSLVYYESTFVETVIYLVIVIHTVLFTILYLKRLLYMAFFTMIAPLIALTYPIDKIKDGQAQAFSTWIKEYTFNALLQPMHLLLYYIFVSSATELTNNWLYAIVAIGFLLPAEKFFRKMFGFDKAESSGSLSAAAGGAAVMAAINKTKQLAQKAGRAGKKVASAAASKGKSSIRFSKSPNGNKSGGDKSKENKKTEKKTNENKASEKKPNEGKSPEKKPSGENSNNQKSSKKRNIKNGARTLLKRYNPFSKKNGKKILKGAGRLTRKGIVGAAGAATFGTLGLAAGIATGDAGKAFGYGAAGAGAGYIGANALGDKTTEFEKKNREIYKEGALGTEEYNTRNSIKELNEDDGFNDMCEQMGIDEEEKEQLIRRFHDGGIKDSKDIKKAVEIMSKDPKDTKEEMIKQQETIMAAQKLSKEAKKFGMKKKDIKEALIEKGITGDKLEKTMELIGKL